ncbi:hypothetical protein [Ruicaihuangia caeni]|uniref:DUF3558 domain-containing protein n=1 Tax=Ruicaihuangia caeni TaxID=3042517 RepID=A0AAW6T1Z1_9MICO|nr:hypothetical protein [Klugiella sp. YN-L-19]MDI2097439.1 hypothetical protein [Klugiella sp. YN-L-19]
MPTRPVRHLLLPIAAVALLLTGCAQAAPEPTPEPEPSSEPESPVVEETPEPSDEPADMRFVLPERCDEILSPTRAADFDTRHLDLLGGPGGQYGTSYFAEPTGEERAGGISCVFGSETMQTPLIVLSVAPLSPSTRPGVMNDLLAQGLNEEQREETIRYEKTGDSQIVPSELHILRGTSWISVITSPGGDQAHAEAQQLAAEVASQVYR